jgi:hypothetical protein
MKFKFHEHRLWVSPDRRDWVQGAYSPPDDSLPEQSADCIVFRTSNGVLNALGQAVYYQQGTTNDGAHFIIGEDGGIVQHQLPLVQTKGQPTENAVTVELINPGPLHEDANGIWRTWWGDPVENDWIRCTEDRTGWACANGQQLHSVIEFVNALRKAYRIADVYLFADECLVLDQHVKTIINNQQWQK